MTARSNGDATPAPEMPAPEAEVAVVRAAKGSVHEAIGKLIGDDAARDHGEAEKRAGAAAGAAATDPRRR
ncbi:MULTISPECIES: hypothetical protein [unclassified Sphingomonas]|uniref:hypothetical protein n=1 Tax=unclassified Sphingomonas TaxID=196159 RepID=UPI001F579B08|nr:MULTISPECIES: hypothetical protein [unclassified Sphingomonas]